MPTAVEFTGRARRDMRRLARNEAKRVKALLEKLAKDARTKRPGLDTKQLKCDPTGETYSARIGNRRCIYRVRDHVVTVLRVMHRREDYAGVPALAGGS